MIDHKIFKLPKKPNKLEFINIKVIDEEELLKIKNKKRNVVEQALLCLNNEIFVDGLYFGSEILDKFKKGIFSKIKVTNKNNLIVCSYKYNDKFEENILDEKVKLEDILDILNKSGYKTEVKLKDKIYKKKINEYDYKILCIGEKLFENLVIEFKIKNEKIAKKLFKILWKKNNYDSIKTQISFMKHISEYRKNKIEI